MPWLLLGGAILLEVIATTCMKVSDGFTRVGPTVAMVVGYIGAFALLGLALKSLSVGTAYAIWAGVGTALVAVAGAILFGEAFGGMKIAAIALIIAGVVVLNLGGAH